MVLIMNKSVLNVLPLQNGVWQNIFLEKLMSLTIEQLAHLADEALDNAYHYGRSTPGNNFGWLANLESARAARDAIEAGITKIDDIAAAVHSGWNRTAMADHAGELELDTPTPAEKKAKRYTLAQMDYDHLPEAEKEKDRVVARTILIALKGNSNDH
jgi:hypothetical protein